MKLRWLATGGGGGCRWGVWLAGLTLVILAVWGGPTRVWGSASILEVESLGLSRSGDTTLLTVLVNRAADARVTTETIGGTPRLVVEFFQAQAGRLPARVWGDDVLVRQVDTEVSSAARTVRITLELIPNRPYRFWRQSRRLASGQWVFLVGLKSAADPAQEERPAPARKEAPSLPEPPTPRVGQPVWKAEAPRQYQPPPEAGGPLSGEFAELGRLTPKTASLLRYLETDGWVLEKSEDYDRPGQRFSRGFFLNNAKHPEMVVKIAYLPANTPGAPNVGIITLSMENLGGETAAEYRKLRKWSFSQIKQKFEDIGDFFDDALKPLRVKLRQQCQELANREATFLKHYLQQAFPGNPEVADQVLKHIQQKVSPRFEGVQYTISEDPLGILNLVDFLFVRVYYLEYGAGGGG